MRAVGLQVEARTKSPLVTVTPGVYTFRGTIFNEIKIPYFSIDKMLPGKLQQKSNQNGRDRLAHTRL